MPGAYILLCCFTNFDFPHLFPVVADRHASLHWIRINGNEYTKMSTSQARDICSPVYPDLAW